MGPERASSLLKVTQQAQADAGPYGTHFHSALKNCFRSSASGALPWQPGVWAPMTTSSRHK